MDFFGNDIRYITTFAVFFVASPLQSALYFNELTFYKMSGAVFSQFPPYGDREKIGFWFFARLVIIGFHGKINGDNMTVIAGFDEFDILCYTSAK